MMAHKTRTTLALTGAVSTALLSAACCLGPLILALLGLGGAGMALAMAPYRPWLLAGTTVLLGAGFYSTYRRPRHECGDGEDCHLPRASRLGRLALWLVAAAVILIVTFPEYSLYIF